MADSIATALRVAPEALTRPFDATQFNFSNTDELEPFRGVLGHEFVGTVIACDDAQWLGQRVVGEINAACGTCATCARGDSSHCPYRTTLGIDRRGLDL